MSLAIGCGPSWTVVKQASPNPFTENPELVEAPAELVSLGVADGSERAFLEGKDADARAAWEKAKSALVAAFARGFAERAKALGLVTTPSKRAFQVVTAIRWIQPGFYSPTAATASRVKISVNVLGADGTLHDTIEVEHGTAASIGHDTIASRLEEDGRALGATVADYLKQRVHPGG